MKQGFLRLLYMLTAIAASAGLYYKPVFNFETDKGIYYTRSFDMDNQHFYAIQTDLKTGVAEVVEQSSIKGMYYCNMAMLATAILTLLCTFKRRWRRFLALLCALSASAYLGMVGFYAIRLSERHFATMYPNQWLALPIIVIVAMILLRSNIIHDYEDEDELGNGEHITFKNALPVVR